MPRGTPRVLLAGRSNAERKRRRAGVRLRDYTVTPSTRRRYEAAVARILPFLEQQSSLQDIDGVICDWVELQWTQGQPINLIADCLSGLHFYWPQLKGLIRHAWKMFRSWRRIETPARAPPLTSLLVRAMVARSVQRHHLEFGALISLGFHCMLRTGELLALRFGDFEFSSECGVVTLHQSKSGLRTGAQEAVAIRDHLTLQLLDTLFSLQPHAPGNKLWPYSPQTFRKSFLAMLRYFDIHPLGFKPYSLRRGSATYLLQCNVPMEAILVRGRWRSLGVARLYLEDGLAQLPVLRIDSSKRSKILLWANKTPATAFRP